MNFGLQFWIITSVIHLTLKLIEIKHNYNLINSIGLYTLMYTNYESTHCAYTP